ncbi:hypothetical protein GCM10010486_70320 [Nonomuraea roseoviolacea subsp. carminata]
MKALARTSLGRTVSQWSPVRAWGAWSVMPPHRSELIARAEAHRTEPVGRVRSPPDGTDRPRENPFGGD